MVIFHFSYSKYTSQSAKYLTKCLKEDKLLSWFETCQIKAQQILDQIADTIIIVPVKWLTVKLLVAQNF